MRAAGSDLVTQPLLVAAAVGLGVGYFRRFRVERPPVGVYTLTDIAVMMVAVVVVPVAYLHLPTGVVTAVLGVMTVFALQFTFAPILAGRFPRWVSLLLAAAAAATDLALYAATPGSDLRAAATVWNNLLLLVLVVGVCNLYAQSGMKARDVAIFISFLTGYDVVATLALPTMGDLLRRVAELPFAPVFTTSPGPDAVTIGLGDVLLLVLWTLVAVKGYGAAAGWLASSTAVILAAALAAAIGAGLISGPFPVMLLAGPAIAAEYLLLRRRHGPERTTAAYRGTPLTPTRPSQSTDDRAGVAGRQGNPGLAQPRVRRAIRQSE
jgi:hypothetical protein